MFRRRAAKRQILISKSPYQQFIDIELIFTEPEQAPALLLFMEIEYNEMRSAKC